MSQLKISNRAKNDLQRLFDFLAQFDLDVAQRGNDAIYDEFFRLQQTPTNGAPVPDRPNVRKLIIDFGASGYQIFHKYYAQSDTTVVLAVLHQKELYELATIGLDADKEMRASGG